MCVSDIGEGSGASEDGCGSSSDASMRVAPVVDSGGVFGVSGCNGAGVTILDGCSAVTATVVVAVVIAQEMIMIVVMFCNP